MEFSTPVPLPSKDILRSLVEESYGHPSSALKRDPKFVHTADQSRAFLPKPKPLYRPISSTIDLETDLLLLRGLP